jgi:hypothetical protein
MVIDPYREWATATKFADYGELKDSTSVLVLIECRDYKAISQLQKLIKQWPGNANYQHSFVSAAYLKPSKAQGRFCTAQIQKQFLSRLDLIEFICRWELGLPIRPTSGKSTSTTLELIDGTVAAVIDDYVVPTHPEFLDVKGKPRIRAVWDQGSTARSLARTNTFGFSYGNQVLPQTLNQKQVNALPRPKLRRAYHGTAVAGLFCGRTSFWQKLNQFEPLNLAKPIGSQDEFVSELPMLVVHLPAATVRDTSGRALGAHILDGLRYILDRCAKTAKIVVNISYGGMAGAHDGTSILDQAIAELVKLMTPEQLVVVFPVGNSREQQCHGRFNVKRNGKQELKWNIPVDSRTPHFLEIWFPEAIDIKAHISLTGPQSSLAVSLNQAQILMDPGRLDVIGMLGFYSETALSEKKKCVAFVALAPTAISQKRRSAPHGVWTITIVNQGTAISNANVWIERNNLAPGQNTFGRQSKFVDPSYRKIGLLPGLAVDDPKANGYVRRTGTTNSRGTNLAIELIGGYRLSDRTLASYSSEGDSMTVPGPLSLAPTEQSVTLRGLRVLAANPSDSVRMQGTSLAAPLWARYALNLFAQNKQPPRTATVNPASLLPDIGLGPFDPRTSK